MPASNRASRSEIRDIVHRFEASATPAEKQHIARELEQFGSEGVRTLVSIIRLGDWDELGSCFATLIPWALALVLIGIGLLMLALVGPNSSELVCALAGTLFLAMALRSAPKKAALSAEILAWMEDPRLAGGLISALWDERTMRFARESLTRIFPRIGPGSNEGAVAPGDLRELSNYLGSFTVHLFGRDLPSATFCVEALELMGRAGGESCLSTLRSFADSRPNGRHDHLVISAAGKAFAELAERLKNIRSGASLLRPTTAPVTENLLYPAAPTTTSSEVLVRPASSKGGKVT